MKILKKELQKPTETPIERNRKPFESDEEDDPPNCHGMRPYYDI